MKILLCGAHGFFGRHLSRTLEQTGHTLIHGVHHFCSNITERRRELLIDYSQDVAVDVWEKRLHNLGNIDVVINAVGILTASAQSPFSALHQATPIALFQAADNIGIKGILQISALGPDDVSRASGNQGALQLSAYLQSKRAADRYLSKLNTPHLILRPSLVVGTDGASSRLFRSLASLPIIALPGKGEQALQPVHIDDICLCVHNWLAQIATNTAKPHQIIYAVGPQAMSYRDMLQHYRDAMQLSPAWFIPIPMCIMRISAKLALYLPQKVFAPETLSMLEQGNVGDNAAFTQLLQQTPRGVENWFIDQEPSALAASAITAWSHLLFRLTLALLWISTGLISLWIYPREDSLQLLAQIGLHDATVITALYLASCTDVLLGIATLSHPSRKLWLAQLVLIVIYSFIIGMCLPEFLTHPFAPILKNIPILAILFVLIAHSTDRKKFTKKHMKSAK